MAMHLGVAAALVGAGAAERDAVGELGFEQLAVSGLVGTRHDAASGAADGGAVEVETDAGDKVLHVALRQAGVGAGGAGLDTAEARVDASAHRLGVSGLFRMGAEHGADGDCGHELSSFCLPRCKTPPIREWFLARPNSWTENLQSGQRIGAIRGTVMRGSSDRKDEARGSGKSAGRISSARTLDGDELLLAGRATAGLVGDRSGSSHVVPVDLVERGGLGEFARLAVRRGRRGTALRTR